MTSRVAVLMPVYKGSRVLTAALTSLVEQTFQNFSVYINDDTPPEFVEERVEIARVVRAFESTIQINFMSNSANLGYPRNLINLVERTSEELIFLCAQDDVLSPIAIESCVRGLDENAKAIAVSRPYFWYSEDIRRPIRRIKSFGVSVPVLVTAASDWKEIKTVLVAASQLTGLMYRRSLLQEQFVDSIFPAHIYPIAGAIRDGGVVYLPYSTVAVSIAQSQTRTHSSIYEESPSLAWAHMYRKVFSSEEFRDIRVFGLTDHIGKNFVGLIQIRCYGSLRYFLREVVVMLRIRPRNVVDPRFLISVFGLSVLPTPVTKLVVDLVKSRIIGFQLRSEALAKTEDAWWSKC